MELIGVDAECKVTRDSGKVDEYDKPLASSEIYSGRCRYQEGVQAYLGTSIRNSVVFIYRYIHVMENDGIEIITSDMIQKKGVAKTVRYIKMPITGDQYTRIELIQVKEVVDGN